MGLAWDCYGSAMGDSYGIAMGLQWDGYGVSSMRLRTDCYTIGSHFCQGWRSSSYNKPTATPQQTHSNHIASTQQSYSKHILIPLLAGLEEQLT